jgi:putative sigma-54 modulation protein
MQVTVTFRNVEATDALRRYADAKVRRAVSKYFRRPLEGHVVLTVNKRRHTADITINAGRVTLNAQHETGDLYSAIDLAVDKIERQAKKQKTRRGVHKSSGATGRATARGGPRVTQRSGSGRRVSPTIVQAERLTAKPMSVEEAMMQLDVAAAEFLVFRNAANGAMNVLYRRKDGNYGLIESGADER